MPLLTMRKLHIWKTKSLGSSAQWMIGTILGHFIIRFSIERDCSINLIIRGTGAEDTLGFVLLGQFDI